MSEANSFTNRTTGNKIDLVDTEARADVEELKEEVTELNETLTELTMFHCKSYTTSLSTSDTTSDIITDIFQNAGIKTSDCYWIVLSYAGGGSSANFIFRKATDTIMVGLIFGHGSPFSGAFRFRYDNGSVTVASLT